MSLGNSQESEVSSSVSSEQTCESSPSASSTPSAGTSSGNTSPKQGRLKTYRRESIAQVKQTSLQQASLARISVAVGSAPDLKGLVQDYGGKLYAPCAWYDRSTGYWRTWQTCLVEGWARFSETWPRSGMTRNGIAYQLVPLVSLSSAIGSGLLPTIGANESKGSQRQRFAGSTQYRGQKMSEGLRTGETDPIYTDPSFAEAAMGFPRGWTLLETPQRHSYRKSSGES